MTNNRTSLLILSLPAIMFLVSSCKKLNQAPPDKFTDLNYWTSPDQANNLLTTAYSEMFTNDYFFYNEALSDNAFNGRGDNGNSLSISNGSINASLSRFESEWQFHYGGIKSCNVLLDNIDRIPNYPEAQKNMVIGQTRFIRAFAYFQLMTWYGDIPLFSHDITLTESHSIPRTPRAQVLSFVLSELDTAAALLPASYSSGNQGRITRGAAVALKARVQLYEGNWQSVSGLCDKLINNGTYTLMTTYDSIFSPYNEHNSEVIFDLEYVPVYRTYSNTFDYVPISIGARDNALAPTQELVNDYLMTNGLTINDPGSGYDPNNPYTGRDPRMTSTIVYHGYQWLKSDGTTKTIYIKPGTDPNTNKPDEYVPGGGFSSPSGYYIRKYYDPTVPSTFLSGLDLILIRYADVLLMYAEAQNELGRMNATVWDQTIGALRKRAGFPAAAAQFNAAWGQDSLRSIIRRERRCELAMEGLRIFDLRRWKTAEMVLNGWGHGAQYGDPTVDNGFIRLSQRTFDPKRNYLWPIPAFELLQDPNLTQNPGW